MLQGLDNILCIFRFEHRPVLVNTIYQQNSLLAGGVAARQYLIRTDALHNAVVIGELNGVHRP